jgi:hypothetical protein
MAGNLTSLGGRGIRTGSRGSVQHDVDVPIHVVDPVVYGVAVRSVGVPDGVVVTGGAGVTAVFGCVYMAVGLGLAYQRPASGLVVRITGTAVTGGIVRGAEPGGYSGRNQY